MKPSTALHPQKRTSTSFSLKILLVSLLILIALSVFSVCIGSYRLDLTTFFSDEMQQRVFFNLRLPRILAALLAGGVLGLCGAVCQTVFCNPLASPDITGVASGASFGAAIAILTTSSMLVRIGFAFAGGVLALVIMLFFVRISGKAGTEEKGRYLLSGVLVSAAAEAGLMILKTAADPERELAAIEFWTMGSFASITLQRFLWMAAAAIVPVILLFIFSRQAAMLSFGHEEATILGLSVRFWQPFLLFCSTLAVAAVVSVVGVIGFIGLIVPNLVLAVIKQRTRAFLPLCFTAGAILCVLSDLLARTLVKGAELPVGIFPVALAVIWFLFLFCRGRAFGGDR